MNILILKSLSNSIYLSSTPQASYVRKVQKPIYLQRKLKYNIVENSPDNQQSSKITGA